MVSGVGTSSGFEERIRFSELEIVDAGAIDAGLYTTLPEGNYVNGWDVNVAGVRTTSVKRHIKHHKHAVSLMSVLRGERWWLTDIGIHPQGQAERRAGVLRGSTIWRF
jgi:hypothetical protein